jgi:hypothetical protein
MRTPRNLSPSFCKVWATLFLCNYKFREMHQRLFSLHNMSAGVRVKGGKIEFLSYRDTPAK